MVGMWHIRKNNLVLLVFEKDIGKSLDMDKFAETFVRKP